MRRDESERPPVADTWNLPLEGAFEACPFGIHVYQRLEGSRLVFVKGNKAADTILGTQYSQFVGKDLEDAFPALAKTEVPARYREVLETGTPWRTERVEYQDGKISGAYELRAYRADADCLFVLFSDITEEKRSEQSRERSARYIDTLNMAAQSLLGKLDAETYQAFVDTIARVSGTDHATLYILSTEDKQGNGLESRLRWCADGEQLAAYESSFDANYARPLTSWLRTLVQGDTPTGSIEDLDPDVRPLFASAGGGHFLLMPLAGDGDSLGAIILERVHDAGPWDDLEVGFLRIAAADLTRALEQRATLQALEASEERFRSMVQEMSDIIWIVDEEARIRYATPSCTRVLGYSPDSLIGRVGLELVHPDDVLTVLDAFNEVVERVNPYIPTEFRFQHADGHWVYLEGTGINLSDQPGIEGMLLTTRDVSQRKEAERSFRLIQFAVEATSDATFLYQRDTRFQYVNEAACRSLGYSREELLRLSVPDIDPRFPEERRVTLYSEVRKTGSYRFESFHRRKDGSEYPVDVSLNLVYFEGTEYVCAIARNISERKRAEAELLRSEERYRSLVENSSDVVATITSDGTIEYVSPSVERILGFSVEESIGTTVFDYVHPEDVPRAQEVLSRVFSGQKVLEKIECRIRTKDGDWRHVETVGREFVNPHGERRSVITYRDVTERIVAEQERQRLESQLRQAQKLEAVGQLAGGIAHDFNNLLTAIRGYTDLAVEELPPEHPATQMLDEAAQASARAESLVRQLLLFSRRSEPQFQIVDLDDVVAGTGKMLGRLIGEHIELRIMPSRESLTIRADPGQIEQILINLCINARDAMPGGGSIEVATEDIELDADFCRHHTWAAEGSYAVLSVLDTGVGIAPEHRERIFEPFFTTKGVGQGTGLGLATVYGIAQVHEGLIEVRSDPGKGTTFRIYFPRSEEAEATDKHPDARSIPAATGQTILLAEDDPQVRLLATRILENGGYRVLAAETGELALNLFDAHKDEIKGCILDVVMPKLSGRQVQERIHHVRPELPILHISGYDFDILEQEMSPGEGVPLLHKPFTSEELLRKLREILA